MQIIIFLLEIVIVFFIIELDSIPSTNTVEVTNSAYNIYYALDTTGQSILIFKNISQKKKIMIWQESALKEEMLSYFPHLDSMSEYINKRIKDDGKFKKRLIEYIEYMHGKYLAGNINQEELREAISNPDPSLPSY